MTVYRRPDPIPIHRQLAEPLPQSLQTVRSELDLHLLVARQIFAAIVSGPFPQGTILPAENLLCNQLGVSRTALREAIKGLVSKGLLETRRRRGTLVLERNRWNMLDADLISWSRTIPGTGDISAQLWQTVGLTQPGLAAIMAGRKTTTVLTGPLAVLSNRASQTNEIPAAVAQFHLAVARAAGNQFVVSLTASCVGNLLREDPAFLSGVLAKVGAEPYESVARSIADGRAVDASSAMNRLFEGVLVGETA